MFRLARILPEAGDRPGRVITPSRQLCRIMTEASEQAVSGRLAPERLENCRRLRRDQAIHELRREPGAAEAEKRRRKKIRS